MSKTTIVQIVKRFGCVGGMESYVWHLAHGLSEKGQSVLVICEEVFGEPSQHIDVLFVPKSKPRPRWKSMVRFRELVRLEILRNLKGRQVIIHSHERSLEHHVTTFHGPPIGVMNRLNLLTYFNKRLRTWRRLEREELLSDSTQVVLPVSSWISKALVDQYPSVCPKIEWMAWPGVEKALPRKSPSIPKRKVNDKLNVLFVGVEWKRKGLSKAVKICEEFRRVFGDITLHVYGPTPSDLPRHIKNSPCVDSHGWSSAIPWANYDALILPAIREPFGMVVAEARMNGLPVLMSDTVGAADLQFKNTAVLPINASVIQWCQVLNQLTASRKRLPEIKWSWDELVDLHLNVIYPRVSSSLI